jgi:UDP-N-acetylglucosamine acyltransferase
MPIHPTAQIDRHAEIDPAADIGPNVVIDGHVSVAAGTKVYPNAYLSGWTKIGANCQIHPGAIVGHLPQDFHFSGERTFCEVGDGTVIREFASVHRGTQPESKTIVGKDCFLMAYCHVGHNCDIRDGAKIYNCAALSGHVEVGANAIVSGYSLLHQFIRIGELAMIGGGSRIGMDVLPFMTCIGESECVGINAIGMRRAGYPAEERTAVKEAYRTLYRSPMTFTRAVEALRENAQAPSVKRIVEFLAGPTKRGFCGPPGHRRGGRPTTRTAGEIDAAGMEE